MRAEYQEQFLAAIRLSRLPGVGAARFAELVKEHGSPLAAWQLLNSQTEMFTDSEKAPMANEIESVSEYLESGGLGSYLGAEDYPQLLRSVPEPPPYLFYRGAIWPLDSFAVAIVGPRDPSQKAARFAGKLARALAGLGVTIISGGAEGIDSAAHRATLEVGGRTALVTATGIDRFYPKENEQLFKQVAQRGCIVTELLPGTPPRKDFFPTRNRIIAGAAQALVVVEGKLKSGSASSFFQMKKLKRPIFTWIHADHRRFNLPNEILNDGGLSLDEPDAEKVVHAILCRSSNC